MESISLNKFHKILETTIDNEYSDIHLTANKKVFRRKKNELEVLENMLFTQDEVKEILHRILNDLQQRQLAKDKMIDCAYSFRNRRFRLNIYTTFTGIAIAMRLISEKAIDLNSFEKADVLKQMVLNKRGLILVCGATGTGKSNTLASMLDYSNRHIAKHIITLEDPIEFIFADDKSLFHQREYRKDFEDFAQAIKMAVRQDPDVIMIGEIRDRETMRVALNAAETGHLVLGTLHASSAVEVLLRVEGFFTRGEVEPVRTQFSSCLNGIIVQQLVPTLKQNLNCCMEILLATPAVRNIIRQGYIQQIESQIQLNRKQGMQLMKDALANLLEKRLINEEMFKLYLYRDR